MYHGRESLCILEAHPHRERETHAVEHGDVETGKELLKETARAFRAGLEGEEYTNRFTGHSAETDSHPGAQGRLAFVQIACLDPERLAAFWGALLGIEVRERVRHYVDLAPTAPGGPAISFQEVPRGKQGNNRVQLAVVVPDLDGATEWVEGQGGRQGEPADFEEAGHRRRWMQDPEGNEFCLMQG
jgi:predicted enzyme related to lactoylglutathione lyase